LRIAGASGDLPPFPLKHTEVHAEIAGLVAQVRVSQVFQNPYDRAIEAVYIFPLPSRAAVDEMEIQPRSHPAGTKKGEARVIMTRRAASCMALSTRTAISSPSRSPTSFREKSP
jgi:hypothetical protein